MANDKLFIPDKIKVGYQKREDTYNGNLAYVIYYDKKGVLRKETSWDGWRNKKIAPNDFDNQPTEGFVLNKGVGGVKSGGWNPRNEYIRVYDPRGFEFEISLANLLFILSESNCFKGKGLEGKFVYAWDGTELVLLPVDTAEYKKSCEFTDLKTLSNIPLKELKYGATYSDAKGEKWVYLGKLDIIRPIAASKAKKFNSESVPCFVSVVDFGYGRYKEINAIFSKNEYYQISFSKKVCLKVNDESEHPKPLVDVIAKVRSNKENSKYFKKVKKLSIEYDPINNNRYRSYDRNQVAD